METRIDEIVGGIYRISTWAGEDESSITLNQFLIDDQRPALVHTGATKGFRDGEQLDLGRHKLRFSRPRTSTTGTR